MLAAVFVSTPFCLAVIFGVVGLMLCYASSFVLLVLGLLHCYWFFVYIFVICGRVSGFSIVSYDVFWSTGSTVLLLLCWSYTFGDLGK
jgi:hypothetical protein